MSHGATSTQKMAFPATSQSFANLGVANGQDTKSSTNGALASLGGGGKVWGSSSIWSSGVTNGLTGSNNVRDTSRSRDGVPMPLSTQGNEFEGKTGSGSLVDSSISEGGPYKTIWGARQSMSSARSISQARYTDAPPTTASSNAGLPHVMPGASQTLAQYQSRPTISLSSNSTVQPRASFGSTYSSGVAGRSTEKPPFNVYTKFDRPTEPMQRKPDSAIGSWADSATTPSPTDERRPQFTSQVARTASMPVSRDGSLPPSRHSDEAPIFARPDYSHSSLQLTPTSSRAPSISSSRSSAYPSYLNGGADQMTAQFSQLGFSGPSSRPGTSYKQPSAACGYSTHGPPMAKAPSFVPTSFRNGHDRPDDIEEIGRSHMGYLAFDDYMLSQQASHFQVAPGASFGERYPHAAANFEFRPGQPFNANSMSHRAYDMPQPSRLAQDWQSMSNSNLSMSRRSPGIPESQSFMDPRMQQMMVAQLRNPYAAMYGAYAMAPSMHFGGPSPYMGLMPLNAMDSQMQRDAQCGDSVQSALMYEFKSNTKTKRYELRDIYEHIAEFSGDQHGSRFIQTKLETANSDEKERVFREIEPNAIPLMTDVFGNYVIQKFFEHGDQTHKKIFANKMRGQVLQLSLQMYGCRVVQKALEYVLVDQQASLIRELEGHVVRCVKDQNGNHVVQKAIERCPASTIGFIISAFHGQVQHLSIHTYGCRVIQRCLEKCDLPSKAMIMAELMEGIQTMISDQFGNYVVQHIVMHEEGASKRQVLNTVGRGLEGYSKHKFASNVVETCLEHSDDHWRREVVLSLVHGNQRRTEGEGVLVGLIKDNYGNYVIQKLLDTLNPEDYCFFVDVLQPAMAQAKRTGCGKQVLSIDKKMHRFPSFRNGGGIPGGVPFNPSQPYQLPLPTPPFASNFTSAATTPPPLTADTQSYQSSCLPSINGDTLEGAASRKGSDPAHDHHMLR